MASDHRAYISRLRYDDMFCTQASLNPSIGLDRNNVGLWMEITMQVWLDVGQRADICHILALGHTRIGAAKPVVDR